jgi:hypothetical protein
MLNIHPTGIDFKKTLSADLKVVMFPLMLPERSTMKIISGFCDFRLNLGTYKECEWLMSDIGLR